MWKYETEQLSIPVEIYNIPDINNMPKYAGHVEAVTGCSEYDTIVISGNSYLTDCFTKFGKDYKVYQQQFNYPTKGGYLCATMVREMLLKGESWEEFVPEGTRRVLEDIDGLSIVRTVNDYSHRIELQI
jgi:nicotinamide mononucleotide adenylyltransferase